MIIEYIGIPGCGKTYQANLYKQKIKTEGKKYLDISRHKGSPLWLKAFYKIANYGICLMPKYKSQIRQYYLACNECSDKPRYFPLPLKICIRDIVLSSLLHFLFAKTQRVILNDEGQLLKIAVLIVQYDVDIQKIMQVYNTEKHFEDIRYIQISVEEAFVNIRKRNRHVCEMDEMKDDELMAYLNKFDQVCRNCLKYIK